MFNRGLLLLITTAVLVFLWRILAQPESDTQYDTLQVLYDYKREAPNAKYNYRSVQEIRSRAALPDSEWVDWYCRRMADQGYLHLYNDTAHSPPLAKFSLTDSLGIDYFLALKEQRQARAEGRQNVFWNLLGSLIGAVLVAYVTYRLTWRNIEKSRALEVVTRTQQSTDREFKLLTAICSEMRENCGRASYYMSLRERDRTGVQGTKDRPVTASTSPTRLSSQTFDLALVEYTSVCSALDILPSLMGFYRDVGFINRNLDAGNWIMGTNFVINKLEAMMRNYNEVHSHWTRLGAAVRADTVSTLSAYTESEVASVRERAVLFSSGADAAAPDDDTYEARGTEA